MVGLQNGPCGLQDGLKLCSLLPSLVQVACSTAFNLEKQVAAGIEACLACEMACPCLLSSGFFAFCPALPYSLLV